MTDGPPASVRTIPAGTAFVDALAAGLIARLGHEPLALAGATVLLPTRRACRSLREALLRAGGGKPMLLPRMSPLGDIDADELTLGGWLDDDLPGGFDLPPAIPGLRRQLLLARLVQAFRSDDGGPEQAVQLAAELATLLDQVQTERLDFARMAELVPAEYAAHWQKTLDFLRLLTERWPEVLDAEGCVDPSERRNQVLAAQAEQWQRHPPDGPIVAAGSTGSIPATADLLDVVARLPDGCVVLPGLDRTMDGESWANLEPTHPQYGMARLLDRLGIDRTAVDDWPGGAVGSPADRFRLASEGMRTAATTDQWAAMPRPAPESLQGVVRLDCPTAREEAGAIALMMREVLETPGRTAALVTPDRNLARRVTGELRRWNIEVDDSAGIPLATTETGTFLKLTAELIAEAAAPVPLLAALKHPLAAVGRDPVACRAAVRRLETAVLRGPRPAAGFDGLAAAVTAADAPAEVSDLVTYLAALATPFATLMAGREVTLTDLVAAHGAFAEALAADGATRESGVARLWRGEAGEAAAAFVAELIEAAADFPPLPGSAYPALLAALMSGRVVRPRYGAHPRLFIWGLLEARLQHADLMILGGLNEGTWPPAIDAGPWMSRPMRQDFGLPLPERRIGLSAHDFVQAFCAPRVALTRATRVDGTPTLPSRWLLRLDNLLGGDGLPRDHTFAAWFSALDEAVGEPVTAPRPRPPVSARPRQLSVSRIETWIRDPYALYADRVLTLRPLDPIDADPGAAERGSIIHDILDRFLRTYSDALPADAEARLIAIGQEVFDTIIDRPGVRAFWWPRFLRIARWVVALEAKRRAAGIRVLATETNGEIELTGPGGPFTLTARADRLDRLADGGLAVIDYKTGTPPSWPQVTSGLVPQLSLEGAMVEAGGFEGVDARSVAALTYLRLSGGRVPGEERVLTDDVATVCNAALDGLNRRIAAYDKTETPYLSRPRPMFIGRFGDYDHLARVKEWSAGGEDPE